MTAEQVIGALVGVVAIVGALIGIGKWLGKREGVESEAKTATRMAITEMTKDVSDLKVTTEKVIDKLDTLTALVVRVDRVEGDVREIKTDIATIRDRMPRATTKGDSHER
jgi:predicted  nucleic acid-binding Zn-ribbon protein